MKTDFDRFPEKSIPGYRGYCGWDEILRRLAPAGNARQAREESHPVMEEYG